MYLPGVFRETRADVLHAHIRAHPLATLVLHTGADFAINHIPLLLRPEQGARGCLAGHVPRHNEVWRCMDGDTGAAAVFQGPDAYITPSWYPSKHEHGRAVPTWNYAVVHVRGRPRVVDDVHWIRRHLEELTNEHESSESVPWKISDAPAEFTERMIEQLVGIEMPIDSIIGKWKVSQNRPRADGRGVVAGLQSRDDAESRAMAGLVGERLGPGDESD